MPAAGTAGHSDHGKETRCCLDASSGAGRKPVPPPQLPFDLAVAILDELQATREQIMATLAGVSATLDSYAMRLDAVEHRRRPAKRHPASNQEPIP